MLPDMERPCQWVSCWWWCLRWRIVFEFWNHDPRSRTKRNFQSRNRYPERINMDYDFLTCCGSSKQARGQDQACSSHLTHVSSPCITTYFTGYHIIELGGKAGAVVHAPCKDPLVTRSERNSAQTHPNNITPGSGVPCPHS